MTNSQVIEKIQKLWSLSQNNNSAHEASLALKMAKDLCAKYQLNLESVVNPHARTSAAPKSTTRDYYESKREEMRQEQRRMEEWERIMKERQWEQRIADCYPELKNKRSLFDIFFLSSCAFVVVLSIYGMVINSH